MIGLAMTMGDPAGIGPEIIARIFHAEFPKKKCLPVVIGSCRILKKTADKIDIPVKVEKVHAAPETMPERGIIPVLEPENIPDLSDLKTGDVQPKAGKAARLFIEKAVQLIKDRQLDAICTAPIHKEAMHAAGFSFPGHTEFLAHLTKTKNFAMLMSGGGIRVVLATIHTSLRSVPELITLKLLEEKIRLTGNFIRYYGVDHPRIALCGLNPHAGEGGMFGDEEEKIIVPAMQNSRSPAYELFGPHPADTVFFRMLQGDFDAVLAMYHDQALIPVKTVAFHDGVNVTMGLPFIRTSVDHGTGFDIAGKGIARPDSLKAAIREAVLLTRNRKKQESSGTGV